MTQKKATIKTASGKAKKSAKAKKNRGATPTYGLALITSADPTTPFTLPVRQSGWFPDGTDIGTTKRKRLFLEEVAGITVTGLVETFPVEFDYNGTSKKWILGGRIDTTKSDRFTKFIRRLAVKLRQYNASLYRLRRLHFYWDYKDQEARLVTFPRANPHGDPKTNPDPANDVKGFKKMVKAAEADWIKVTGQVNDLLEKASTASNSFGVTLLGADMIAANGYIVSMRVVVKPRVTNAGHAIPAAFAAPEVGGSSSHVSLESAFSSPSQK
jgi:hypothetical protein